MKKRLLLLLILMSAAFPSWSSPEFTLLPEERAFLDDLEPLVVVMDDNYPPITVYNNRDGNYSGIGAEVFYAVSDVLGVEYTVLQDDELGWSDKLEMIKNSGAHILVGASVNDDRQEYGYFTRNTYFSVNYALIGNVSRHIPLKKIEDAAFYRIGLPVNLSINEYLKEVLPDAEFITFPDQESAYEALLKGEVDLVPENEAVFIDEYFTGNRFDFEIAYSIMTRDKHYAFFVPKTETGKRVAGLLDRGMEKVNISAIQSAHYENRSIFSFYREQTEELYRKSARQNYFLIILVFVMVSAFSISLVVIGKNRQLRRISEKDFLTGAGSRFLLFSKKRHLKDENIFFIDLDDFKPINDRFGHDAGDHVLVEIVARLKELQHGNEIFRIGGDEFILTTSRESTVDTRNLLDEIGKGISFQGNDLYVSASIGYILSKDIAGRGLEEILYYTDIALYEAKATGKNGAFQVTGDFINSVRKSEGDLKSINFRDIHVNR